MKICLDASVKPYLYLKDGERYKEHKNIYIQNKFVNLQRLDDFQGLIKELPDIVLLKGLDLALNYYKDLGVREFEDIDILIDEGRVRDVKRYFETNGYHRYYRSEKLNSFEYYRGITKFHVHLKLENAIYPQPYFKALEVKYKDYLKVSEVDGMKYRRLEENFNFIYVVFHALKHNFDKSIRLLDIVKVSKFVQWNKVYSISKALNCDKLLLLTLQHLFDLSQGIFVPHKLISNNSVIKGHSGLDLAFYFYINPLSFIFYLPRLTKNFIYKIY